MVWSKNVRPGKGARRAKRRIAWMPTTVLNDENGVEVWIWLEMYLSLEENTLLTDDGMTCFLYWDDKHKLYLGDAIDIKDEIHHLIEKYKWSKGD